MSLVCCGHKLQWGMEMNSNGVYSLIANILAISWFLH